MSLVVIGKFSFDSLYASSSVALLIARKTFTERLPPFVEPWAQVTTRLFVELPALSVVNRISVQEAL